jgi:hypothetical protein
MAVIPEIVPSLQFNHSLVKDEEPLLFYTGLRRMHGEIREAVSRSSTFLSCVTSASAVSSRN